MSNPTSYTDAALNYKNAKYNDFHQPYEPNVSDEESSESSNSNLDAMQKDQKLTDYDIAKYDQKVIDQGSTISDDEELHQSTILMTSFNVINSIIGSGIVGMPYALRKSGYGFGIILLIIVSIATDQSLKFIIQSGQISNTNTYQDMVKASLGHDAYIVLTIMQIMYPFIAMVSYNVIIGDTLTKLVYRILGEVASQSVVGDRRFIIFLTSIFICFPLSSIKQVSRLSRISVFSTFIVIGIVVTMIYRVNLYSNYTKSFSENAQLANWKIPQAIAVMAFAFMCQHNSFICFRSLRKRSAERWSIVVHFSVIFSFVCSALFALAGYVTFKNSSQGDIFENYCFMDDVINVARFLFALVIIFTYPVECVVVREVIETVMLNRGKQVTQFRHYLITVIIVILAMFASMTTSCLSIILELNGVLTAAPMAFILPPLCLMRLKNEPIFRSKNSSALFILIFGSIVILFGSITLIIDLVQGVRCNHAESYNYCQELFHENSTKPIR